MSSLTFTQTGRIENPSQFRAVILSTEFRPRLMHPSLKDIVNAAVVTNGLGGEEEDMRSVGGENRLPFSSRGRKLRSVSSIQGLGWLNLPHLLVRRDGL